MQFSDSTIVEHRFAAAQSITSIRTVLCIPKCFYSEWQNINTTRFSFYIIFNAARIRHMVFVMARGFLHLGMIARDT